MPDAERQFYGFRSPGLLPETATVVVEGQKTLWRVGRRGPMTVHHHTCGYLKRAKHKWVWSWPAGRTLAEVFSRSWNVPCTYCMTRIESGKP